MKYLAQCPQTFFIWGDSMVQGFLEDEPYARHAKFRRQSLFVRKFILLLR